MEHTPSICLNSNFLDAVYKKSTLSLTHFLSQRNPSKIYPNSPFHIPLNIINGLGAYRLDLSQPFCFEYSHNYTEIIILEQWDIKFTPDDCSRMQTGCSCLPAVQFLSVFKLTCLHMMQLRQHNGQT